MGQPLISLDSAHEFRGVRAFSTCSPTSADRSLRPIRESTLDTPTSTWVNTTHGFLDAPEVLIGEVNLGGVLA
jgi:hypothetical protein